LIPNQFVHVRLFLDRKPQTHFVPQSVVDSARAAQERVTQLSQAGFSDPSAVLKTQEQLRWAEAMYAGDRLGAALARRDGARERLALLQERRLALMKSRGESGAVPQDDGLIAVERELAEAEAQVSELKMSGTLDRGLPTVTRNDGHLVPQSVVDQARESLAMAQKRFEAGSIHQATLLKAKEQLQWAEAMFAGDRLAAAKARRDGARERWEVLQQLFRAGTASGEDIAAVEREMAEAEAQVSELQGTGSPQGGPPSAR
jgi:hypothetical protein